MKIEQVDPIKKAKDEDRGTEDALEIPMYFHDHYMDSQGVRWDLEAQWGMLSQNDNPDTHILVLQWRATDGQTCEIALLRPDWERLNSFEFCGTIMKDASARMENIRARFKKKKDLFKNGKFLG